MCNYNSNEFRFSSFRLLNTTSLILFLDSFWRNQNVRVKWSLIFLIFKFGNLRNSGGAILKMYFYRCAKINYNENEQNERWTLTTGDPTSSTATPSLLDMHLYCQEKISSDGQVFITATTKSRTFIIYNRPVSHRSTLFIVVLKCLVFFASRPTKNRI